jgi:peptidoglycan/xylan/chitin deacetylase (PgdA/CDA1 family)/CelD/BcsL family acetyltransferase involved in cellulose biosynthesis
MSGAAMRVVAVRTLQEWQALEPVWNRLVDASATGTTFLTWEWLSSWWAAYGGGAPLEILLARDEAGVIRGIAPLCRQALRRYGHTYDTLMFIGDGSSDSDYLDFIVERGAEEAVMTSFWRHLEPQLTRGLVLRLNEVPDPSPTMSLFRSLAASRYLWTQESVACATLSLPPTWDEFLAALRPRFRTKVRSVLRQLEARPEVRFGFCTTTSALEQLLPALFDLHTRRWNADGQPGVFVSSQKRRFYSLLSPLLLSAGVLRLSWLEWRGKVLAAQYGFMYRGTYLHLQEGYEPASEHWNIGIGLRAWTIRQFLREGVREYDSLAGIGRHKMDWGAHVKESRRITIAARTVANRVLCHGPEWTERTKAVVKAVVPQQILDMRRPRVAERSPSGWTGHDDSRLRRITARSYFHLGLPAAARVVRSRFQLGAGEHRISWPRRRRPSGRILYYHRVNDDRDPFFPSAPLKVFDSQMRFVARHYRVVPLSVLIEHLQSGSTETVIAITFDDGYQDNYSNALPILQRYRLPATIFLTTGSIDSREPLWFETLAAALKTTTQECLDVEMDVPLRFWLRTVDERLHANAQLFTVLRRMPDAERQLSLNVIIRELAAPIHDRQDQMLTWDQVRRMREHAIEFGGHTVTHPFMSKLSPERARWEVAECKRRIEAEVQAPARHFAYPSGRHEDVGPSSKEIVRMAGYEAAVSTEWGLNYAPTDRFELRRGGPWEEDEAVFAYKMDWYHLVNG